MHEEQREREHERKGRKLAPPRDIETFHPECRQECESASEQHLARNDDARKPTRDSVVHNHRAGADDEQDPVGNGVENLAELGNLIEPSGDKAIERIGSAEPAERLRFILRSQKEAYLPLRVIRDRLGTGDTSMSGTIPIVVDPTVTEPIITDPIVTDPIVADPIVADERVPVWMKDHAANTALPPTPHAQPVTALALSSNEVSLNAAELERAAGIDATLRLELEAYRLIAPRLVAGEAVYGDDALIIARTAASFAQLGIELAISACSRQPPTKR